MTRSRRSPAIPTRCVARGTGAGLVDVVAALDQLQARMDELAGTRSGGPVVASVLERNGLAPDALRNARARTHPHTSGGGPVAVGMTLGALIALSAADDAERSGADATTVVRRARSAAGAYVGILPSRLLH